jgi:hypothetical protein
MPLLAARRASAQQSGALLRNAFCLRRSNLFHQANMLILKSPESLPPCLGCAI